MLAGSVARELHGRPAAVQEGIASMLTTRWAIPILYRARGREAPPEDTFVFPLLPPLRGPLDPAASPPVAPGVR
eukprot:52280-Alexandrium_andersonii.AAC.1